MISTIKRYPLSQYCFFRYFKNRILAHFIWYTYIKPVENKGFAWGRRKVVLYISFCCKLHSSEPLEKLKIDPFIVGEGAGLSISAQDKITNMNHISKDDEK